MTNLNKAYEPGIWRSYGTNDRVDFLIELGCRVSLAEEYALRDFDSLPYKIRAAIEKLEHFDE